MAYYKALDFIGYQNLAPEIGFTLPEVTSSLVMRIGTSDRPTFEKFFVYGEYDLLLTTKQKFIIYAEANVGYASVLFANQYPDAKIIAVKPEVENFNLLK